MLTALEASWTSEPLQLQNLCSEVKPESCCCPLHAGPLQLSLFHPGGQPFSRASGKPQQVERQPGLNPGRVCVHCCMHSGGSASEPLTPQTATTSGREMQPASCSQSGDLVSSRGLFRQHGGRLSLFLCPAAISKHPTPKFSPLSRRPPNPRVTWKPLAWQEVRNQKVVSSDKLWAAVAGLQTAGLCWVLNEQVHEFNCRKLRKALREGL